MNEEFWKGDFGNRYQERQKESKVGNIYANEYLFSKILASGKHPIWMKINSIAEFGAGTGQNIHALHNLFSMVDYWSIELNPNAAEQIPHGKVITGSVLDVKLPQKCDLVFTKGLCIHIHPDDLPKLYQNLYDTSLQYILLCEYYNPTPVEIDYRGHAGKLWKRDFAGDMLSMYPDLQLLSYGFVYHKDKYPQDDLTWFLLEKKKVQE